MYDDFKFGIEIECFRTTRPKILDKLLKNQINTEIQLYNHSNYDRWKIIWDGSVTSEGTEEITNLHGEKVYKGIEIVSPILFGENGLNQIKLIYGCLNELNTKVDNTCGTHMHFDAEILSVKDIKNILIFYYNNQLLFDSMIPKNRKSLFCKYCEPISSSEITVIKDLLSREDIGEELKTRHKVINARSQKGHNHNTIEFRQLNGTLNYDEIQNWILLMYKIIKYCCNYNGLLTIKHNLTLQEQLDEVKNLLNIENTELYQFIIDIIEKFKK